MADEWIISGRQPQKNENTQQISGAVTQSGTWTTGAGSANIVVDSNNTTESVLTAGATYTGTATDISAYSQVNIDIYGEPSTAKASFYFEFSKNGTNWDISVPHFIRNPSLVIPIPVINVHKYFRVKYINDGGAQAISDLGITAESAGTPTLQTTFRLTSYLLPRATKELTRTLDQSISGSDPVSIVRSVQMGKLPDGSYSNVPGRGRSATNNTTSTLLANAVYTGTFEPTTGYVSISVLINTDQTSASEGVEVQQSDDGTNVRFADKFAITSTEVLNGWGYFTVPARAEYVRIKYTNGGTNQGSFRLRTYLSPTTLDNIETTVEAPISSSNTTELSRNVILAKNDSNAYGNVTRGSSGGLRTSINQHEVDTPIKPLDNSSGSQISVLTSATQLDTSQLTNRKGIVVKALNSNNQKIYVGFSSGVTTGNGYELDAGQFVEMDLSTSKQIWAIANSSTQTACIIQVAT